MKKAVCIIVVILLFTVAAWADTPLQQEVLKHYTVISQEPVTLHIGFMNDCNGRNELLEAAFLAKYPNATIEYQRYAVDQVPMLYQGGMELPDLLLCTSIVMDKMADHDMLMDIYQTGLISTWPEGWIDISEELEINGKLYGLPTYINQYYWMWNDELAQKSGAMLPDYPYSWDQFVEMAAALDYDFDDNGLRDMRLIQGRISTNEYRQDMVDDFFVSYFENRIVDHRKMMENATFCTDEFQHLLELYKKMLEIRSVWRENASDSSESAYLIKSLGLRDSFWFYDGMHSVALPPTVNAEEPAYVGTVEVAAIPVAAGNPELALAFCEGMLDENLNRYYSNLERFFFKSMPACYVYMDHAKADDSNISCVTIDSLQMDTWEFYETPITQDAFDMFTFCREHVLVETMLWRSLSAEWEECLTGYMAGELTFEQVAERLDTAARTMLNE